MCTFVHLLPILLLIILLGVDIYQPESLVCGASNCANLGAPVVHTVILNSVSGCVNEIKSMCLKASLLHCICKLREQGSC